MGSNFPVDPKLAAEETSFSTDRSEQQRQRPARPLGAVDGGEQGRIDVEAGKRFLADHFDTYTKKEEPDERTLCGHIDLSPRGMMPWQGEHGPAGAVQNKVADAAMASRMSFTASAGHACGLDFKAAEHVAKYPDYAWQQPLLRDMPSRPWTIFTAAR